MQRQHTDIQNSLKTCCKLLQSWLKDVNDPKRRTRLNNLNLPADCCVKEDDFNTFGVLIPNTRTRMTLKNGVVTFFDYSDEDIAKLLYNHIPDRANACIPSNIPNPHHPAIAQDLFEEIERIVNANPDDLSIEGKRSSGRFCFTVTGDLSLLATDKKSQTASFQAAAPAEHRYLMIFRSPLKKGRDYITDNQGRVAFITQAGKDAEKIAHENLRYFGKKY